MKLRSGKRFCHLSGSYRFCSDENGCEELIQEWKQEWKQFLSGYRKFGYFRQDIEKMKEAIEARTLIRLQKEHKNIKPIF